MIGGCGKPDRKSFLFDRSRQQVVGQRVPTGIAGVPRHVDMCGFLSLRVGLYSTGAGAVKFSDFSYRAIKETSGK